jgi:hypothetical protein
MQVSIFENSGDDPLTFTIEPCDQRYEVPPLAKIGVRYAFADGAANWTRTDVGKHSISFWCDAAEIEVEIVHPGAFDRLMWQLCPKLGFCGSFVNGEDRHVTDLIPAGDTVTAAEFALMAIEAEGFGDDEAAARERWLPRIEALFCEYMGADPVPAEALRWNLANPFDELAPT